jgi:hypothetical protein
MTNQFFSPRRFLKYFRFQLNLLGKGYLLAYAAALMISLIVAILLVAVDMSDKYARPFQQEYQAIVLFGLGVVSILIGTWMYARLNKKESIIGFLSVPSSHFEKTVASFILSFVIPAILCLFFYLICEQAMFAYFRSHCLPYVPNEYYRFAADEKWRYYGVSMWRQILEMSDTKVFIAFFVSLYFAIHSFFVLGSLIFRRFSFVLTSISFGLLIFFSVALAVLLSYGILGADKIYLIDRYSNHILLQWFGTKGYRESEHILIYGSAGIFMLTALVLWCTTHLKLTEKEVR